MSGIPINFCWKQLHVSFTSSFRHINNNPCESCIVAIVAAVNVIWSSNKGDKNNKKDYGLVGREVGTISTTKGEGTVKITAGLSIASAMEKGCCIIGIFFVSRTAIVYD